MKENCEQNIEYLKELPNQDITIKETNTKITSVTPVTKKDHEDCTIEPIEKIVPVDLAEPKTVLVQKKAKSKFVEKRQNLCLTCNNYVQSCVPKCIWYQDKNYIYLKFDILETNTFSLNCTFESIIFKAQSKDTSYNFCAKLFGFIIEENVTYKTSYEGFHIKAEKLYKIDHKWPRLFMCDKWHKYINYDPDHIDHKHLDFWLREMNKFKMIALQTPLVQNNVIYDSSDCDSADDDFITND